MPTHPPTDKNTTTTTVDDDDDDDIPGFVLSGAVKLLMGPMLCKAESIPQKDCANFMSKTFSACREKCTDVDYLSAACRQHKPITAVELNCQELLAPQLMGRYEGTKCEEMEAKMAELMDVEEASKKMDYVTCKKLQQQTLANASSTFTWGLMTAANSMYGAN